jgi:hypothetical protein
MVDCGLTKQARAMVYAAAFGIIGPEIEPPNTEKTDRRRTKGAGF